MKQRFLFPLAVAAILAAGTTSCQNNKTSSANEAADSTAADTSKFLSQPLVTDNFSADPSAHIFEGKIYIYPSHDIDAATEENDNGDHFAMNDYHVYSMDSVGGKVTDHGVVLSVKDIPWAGRQLWAPDAAYKNGKYYLYFPLKDKEDIFRIGVAVADKPYGPFKAEPKPIEGSFSMDPTLFADDDGSSYLYFGGIWGGQLQKWENGKFNKDGSLTDSQKEDEPALRPRIAKMNNDMLSFAEPVKEIKIVDKSGKELLTKDHERRFFEAAWVHKYNGKYYFSYSTGNTHYIAYATGDNPYGPFIYQGNILNPVQGWTNHHSIVEHNGKWWLFYHDTQLSGKTHLRNIKVTELKHNTDGSIQTIDPIKK